MLIKAVENRRMCRLCHQIIARQWAAHSPGPSGRCGVKAVVS
jgi:hypothetical protein